MAIVPNWTDPLEESLKDLVSRSYLAGEDVSKYRDTASLLEGTPVPQHIEQHIAQLAEDRKRRAAQAAEKKARETEEAYQQALSYISMDQIAAIGQGIKELEALHGYKDADDKIQEAHTKIARLKKKQLLKKLSKVAAVLVVILGVIIYNAVSRNKTMAQIANAQALADAGQNTEALAIIEELNLQGKSGASYPDIFTVTETVLENIAAEEGLLAACTLMDQLSADMPNAVQAETFDAYAAAHVTSDPLSISEQGQILFWLRDRNKISIEDETIRLCMRSVAAELPTEDAWSMLTRAINLNAITWDEDFVQPVAVAHAGTLDIQQRRKFIITMQNDLRWDTLAQTNGLQLNALTEEINANTEVDLDAWMDEHGDLLDQYGSDPDAALQLLYALNDAGYDPCALFPEGIKVSLPIAARTWSMIDDLNEGIEQDEYPDLSALLPISVIEERVDTNGIRQRSQSELDDAVEAMQLNDDNYDVRLLPEYLFRLPESLRPVTFSDCTTLLCMQQIYCHSSTISNSTTYTTTYYPAFYALDFVTTYEIADPDMYGVWYADIHDPQVEDEQWFELHKKDDAPIYNSNLLGEFDTEALKEAYDSAFNLFILLR